MRFEKLAASVAEGVDGAVNEGGGGELAGGLAVGFEWGGELRYLASEGELGEGAMDLASGVDALDDLLAEIAALREVQRVGLGGFLREDFFGDVDAEFGDGGENAEGFEGFGGDLRVA